MPIRSDALDQDIEQTHQWLDDVATYLELDDRSAAYQALSSVLIALREHIGADHAAHLAGQMPLLIRGAFYDGPEAAGLASREVGESTFLDKVRQAGAGRLAVPPEAAASAVFRTLAERMDAPIVDEIAALFATEMGQVRESGAQQGADLRH